MNEETHTKKEEAKPENPDANQTTRSTPRWAKSVNDLLAFLALISIGTIATIVKATNHLTGGFRPEVALPILLVAGLIALVMTLAILVAPSRSSASTSKAQPSACPREPSVPSSQ